MIKIIIKKGLQLLLVYLCLFNLNYIFAQSSVGNESNDATNYIPKISPSSPEAFKFGSYGNIPIGLFTGSPNVNIPLVYFKQGQIQIPVSINYSSNGIHLDELNGSVGLGWSLVSAGVITRTVRGLPDEENSYIKTLPDIDKLGLWSPDVVNYLHDCQYGNVDAEPDLYTANFCGNNIKFTFNANGFPLLYSQINFQIEGRSGGNSFIITDDQGIKYYFSEQENVTNRTQGNGHSIPQRHVSAWYLSKIADASGHEVIIEYNNSGYSTITSQSQTLIYTPPGLIQWKLVDVSDDNGYNFCHEEIYTIPTSIAMGSTVTSNQRVSGKQIKRIYSSDSNNNIINEVDFTYNAPQEGDFNSLKEISQSANGKVLNDFTFTYDLTPNGRLFLKTITNQKDFSKHTFEYLNKEDLPQRLSTDYSGQMKVCYSRDMWGFYNGADNDKLIPQIFDQNDFNSVIYDGANQEFNENKGYYGLMNKIIYPTGGSTEIIYEPHRKTELKTIPGPKQNVFLGVSSTNNPRFVTKTVNISPKKDETIKFEAHAFFNSEEPSCTQDTGHAGSILTIRDINNQFLKIKAYSSTFNTFYDVPGTEYGSLNIVPDFALTEFFVDLKKDVPVTFELKTKSGCSSSYITFDYTTEYDTVKEVQTAFGGFRVQKTIDNPISGSSTIKNYWYVNQENKSSVFETRKPYFLEQQATRSYCRNGNFKDLYYFSLTSTNVNQLISFNPNIYYGMVIEEISGKGKAVHHFNINTDYFGRTLIGKDISFAPWTNFGWDNGKEMSTDYFDDTGNKIKNITNNYVEDNSKERYVDGISFRKNFDLKFTTYATLTCTLEEINKTWTDYYCDTDHNHEWLIGGYPLGDGHTKCIASGNHNTTRVYHGPCFNHEEGEVIVNPNSFENMDFVQYKNISRFDYLASQTTTDYLNGNPIQTKTEYFYNNPLHYQPTSQKTVFPDSSEQVTDYQYAHEKGNTYLTGKNMVGIPLETTVTKKQNATDIGKVISQSRTDYPTSEADAKTRIINNVNNKDYPLPFEALSKNLETGGNMEKQVSYDKYDNKGNLLQYTIKSGVPTTIIWGYNQTQPIAKIEGATYDQVSSLASSIINASNDDANDTVAGNPKEADLLIALDNFRIAFPQYQITTYSFDPLIGVRSITPPSGVREVYHYDTANRLEKVVDVTGKILKEYKYNYKQ